MNYGAVADGVVAAGGYRSGVGLELSDLGLERGMCEYSTGGA